jgi:alcohol dehydrogenase class IV
MMLRESSKFSNEAVDLHDVSAGLSAGTEVAHAPLLVAFAEAVVARDTERIAPARQAILEAMGPAAFVDAASTAAAFHGFTRIADAIGIPYKTAAAGQDAPDVRELAGVNAFYRLREESNLNA